MKNRIVPLLIGILTALACEVTSAAVAVFTDRSLWTAAVSGVTTEDFNSFPNETPVTAATVFPSGITQDGGFDINSFAWGAIGEGTGLRIFDVTTITMPGLPAAFGFDYADVDLDGVIISFGSFSQALPLTGDADAAVTPDVFAFFGVVATSADIPAGTFQFAPLPLEGFTIDNLSFGGAAAVPEPATLALLGLGLAGLGFSRRTQ